MARWHLKSPRSLSDRSLHLTLITKWSRSWSWMTCSQPLCSMSIDPPILRYNYFKIWPWKFMVKVMCVIKGQGHIWPWKFKGQGQTHGSHLRPRYICFSFHGNRTTFGWDIANSISALDNTRSMSWPRSHLMFTFEALSSIDMFSFGFVAIGPFLVEIQQIQYLTLKIWGQGQGQIWWSHLRPGVQSIYLLFVSCKSDHFWLRYSKFHIWPWKFQVKVMAKVTPDGHIWGLELHRYVCFWFRGNQTIFGWDIANSTFDLENSRSNPMVKFEA